jgi:alcohol dehydrogenase class IV
MKLVAVPTTSGTGSEVSPFSVLTDDETHQKRFLKHPALMPAVALCDPLLTVTMPVQVTADTGIDALSHAVEAYLSVLCQGFMEGIALESCRLVAENLPVVLENDPGDMTARENLMLAALDGGIVLANCGTVFVHALGYCLTAKFGYTHGKANAILLAGFVEHLAERGSPRAQAILDIFGGSLRAFIERCGVPQKLPPGSVTSDEFAAWVSTGYNAYGRVNGVIALDRSDVENVLNRVIA